MLETGIDKFQLINKDNFENENDFKSTIVKVAATDFESNNKRNLFYALALVLGGMIGVAFVLISNALKIRQNIESKS